MNNKRVSEKEVCEAIATYFTQYEFTVETECEIQFGAGKGRMHGIADVVVKNPEGYWVAVVECKSGRIGKTLEGEWQLKSYLSATDTRFGILAASSDPADWVYFENLRSNVFIKRERPYFNARLNDPPKADRPDHDAINELKTENNQLETDNDKLKAENNQLETNNNQLKADNEQLETENNQLETDNDKLETENNQLETNNNQLKADNEQLKADNEQLETDNNQLKRKIKLRTIVLSISALVIAAGISTYFLILLPIHANPHYQVIRIIDGDTVEIKYKGKLTSVQLFGVNAPETVRSGKPLEPYGEEAAAYLQKILLDDSIYLRFDEHMWDQYERILGYVYRVSDGIFLNLEMIREGYARVDTRYPFKYEELFTDYESRARTDRKGLWSSSLR